MDRGDRRHTRTTLRVCADASHAHAKEAADASQRLVSHASAGGIGTAFEEGRDASNARETRRERERERIIRLDRSTRMPRNDVSLSDRSITGCVEDGNRGQRGGKSWNIVICTRVTRRCETMIHRGSPGYELISRDTLCFRRSGPWIIAIIAPGTCSLMVFNRVDFLRVYIHGVYRRRRITLAPAQSSQFRSPRSITGRVRKFSDACSSPPTFRRGVKGFFGGALLASSIS